MRNDLPKRIKDVRDSYNLSQERFGKKIGVSGKTISAYEKGRIVPTRKILVKIAEIYNINLIEIPSMKKNTITEKIQSIERSIQEIKNILNISFSD